MRVLRELVFMMKSRGPKAEPWEEVYKEDRLLSYLTWKQQDDK